MLSETQLFIYSKTSETNRKLYQKLCKHNQTTNIPGITKSGMQFTHTFSKQQSISTTKSYGGTSKQTQLACTVNPAKKQKLDAVDRCRRKKSALSAFEVDLVRTMNLSTRYVERGTRNTKMKVYTMHSTSCQVPALQQAHRLISDYMYWPRSMNPVEIKRLMKKIVAQSETKSCFRAWSVMLRTGSYSPRSLSGIGVYNTLLTPYSYSSKIFRSKMQTLTSQLMQQYINVKQSIPSLETSQILQLQRLEQLIRSVQNEANMPKYNEIVSDRAKLSQDAFDKALNKLIILEDENRNLKDQIHSLEYERDKNEEVQTELQQKQRQNYTNLTREYTSRIEEFTEQNNKLKKENDILKTENDSIKIQIKNEKKQYLQDKEYLDNEIDRLRKESTYEFLVKYKEQTKQQIDAINQGYKMIETVHLETIQNLEQQILQLANGEPVKVLKTPKKKKKQVKISDNQNEELSYVSFSSRQIDQSENSSILEGEIEYEKVTQSVAHSNFKEAAKLQQDKANIFDNEIGKLSKNVSKASIKDQEVNNIERILSKKSLELLSQENEAKNKNLQTQNSQKQLNLNSQNASKEKTNSQSNMINSNQTVEKPPKIVEKQTKKQKEIKDDQQMQSIHKAQSLQKLEEMRRNELNKPENVAKSKIHKTSSVIKIDKKKSIEDIEIISRTSAGNQLSNYEQDLKGTFKKLKQMQKEK